MGCEDDIVRTTIYMPKYLYKEKKRREQSDEKFNLSQTIVTILETQFFGDGSTNLQFEIEQTQKQIQKLDNQKSILTHRATELQKLIDTQQERQGVEAKLFNKFKTFMVHRTKNAESMGVDYKKIIWRLQSDFFPDNSVDEGLVKDMMDRCKKDSLDFDFFRKVRKGA